MDTVVITNSRWHALLLLLGSLGFVAGGVFILVMDKSALAGWAGIVFFGSCALIAVWQLVDNRPRLIIDDYGVMDRTLGIGVIPWDEIENAFLRSISGCAFVCLVLRDPEKYTQNFSKVRRAMASANQALGFTEFNVNLAGVNARAEEVFELILKKCAATRVSSTFRGQKDKHIVPAAAVNDIRYRRID
jgi:hypothetical protein